MIEFRTRPGRTGLKINWMRLIDAPGLDAMDLTFENYIYRVNGEEYTEYTEEFQKAYETERLWALLDGRI